MAKTADYHHGNLRAELINAGAQLIENKGVADVSLREVAKAAGVSHTAPYRHFKDKNALMSGITEVGFQQLADNMQAAAQQFPDDPKKQLIKAGVAYVSIALHTRQMFHLMFGGVVQCDDDSEALQQSSDAAFAGLVAIIANGQEAGIYKDADTNVLALTAWSLVHGYAMLVSIGKLDHIVSGGKATLALATELETHLIEGIGVK